MDQTALIVAGFIGTAILSILGTYLAVAWGRRRKIMAYQIQSMVVRSPSGALKISVPRSLTFPGSNWSSDYPEDIDRIDIEAAYTFEVRLRNSGNDVLDRPVICVEVDKSGTIVDIDTEPESRIEYQITRERDAERMNVCRVIPPYLNAGDRMKLKVTSVNNANIECLVRVFGAGLKARDVGSIRRLAWEISYGGFLAGWGLLVVWFSIAWLLGWEIPPGLGLAFYGALGMTAIAVNEIVRRLFRT